MAAKVGIYTNRMKKMEIIRTAGYTCLHYRSNLDTLTHKKSWNSLKIRDPNGKNCVTEMSHFKRMMPNSLPRNQTIKTFQETHKSVTGHSALDMERRVEMKGGLTAHLSTYYVNM